jgi:hypothetical protein
MTRLSELLPFASAGKSKSRLPVALILLRLRQAEQIAHNSTVKQWNQSFATIFSVVVKHTILTVIAVDITFNGPGAQADWQDTPLVKG